MRDELPALTTFQQIGLIMATPSYNDGEAYLDEGDMTSVAVLLDTYKAERDAERDAATARAEAAEADARECRAERARYGDAMTEKLAAVEADRIAARALAFRMRRGRDAARDDCRLLVERVKAVTPYAVNTASWVTLLATIGIEPEDMRFSK